ncbi:MAG: hypothetical protein RCG15_02555 [Candidatus Rickettsia vulgarisii]
MYDDAVERNKKILEKEDEKQHCEHNNIEGDFGEDIGEVFEPEIRARHKREEISNEVRVNNPDVPLNSNGRPLGLEVQIQNPKKEIAGKVNVDEENNPESVNVHTHIKLTQLDNKLGDSGADSDSNSIKKSKKEERKFKEKIPISSGIDEKPVVTRGFKFR